MACCLVLPSRQPQQSAMGLGAMAGCIRTARECFEESQQLKAPSPSQSWAQYTSRPTGTRHRRMHARSRTCMHRDRAPSPLQRVLPCLDGA